MNQLEKQLAAARDDSDSDGKMQCTTKEAAGVMSVRKYARTLNSFFESFFFRIRNSPA